MCGITGFANKSNGINASLIEQMSNTLHHRGPDGGDTWQISKDDVYVSFGHRRLSIIDLSETAKQPMHYKHYSIVFNGEIYNYAELKQTLIALGHTFITNSDTEVLLHCFEEYGAHMLNKFIGMFAFVIYDANKQQLFFARDRAGVKPFFFYHTNTSFIFGSELKALLKHPESPKKLNQDALGEYLRLGFVPHYTCIWQGVQKLSAGSYGILELSDFSIKVEKYWNPAEYFNKPKFDLSYENALSICEDLVRDATRYRMVSDVPVGVFLSGGYDSSLVAAMMKETVSTPLNSFTIGMPSKDLDEREQARKIAHHLNYNHHEYELNSSIAEELLQQLPYYYDEPFGDSSAIPTMLVSKEAKKHVTVALSADAGDELFLGYNKYDHAATLFKIINTANYLPHGVINASLSGTKLILNKFKKLQPSARRLALIQELIPNGDVGAINKTLNSKVQQKYIDTLLLKPSSKLLQEEAYSTKSINSALDWLSLHDYQNYLQDDILQKVDRGTMSASIEGREPLLDHRLLEFAAQLPTNFKYDKRNKKRIIKDIVHKYVPRSIMTSQKRGFAIPVDTWLRGPLKPLVLHYLGTEFVQKQQLFKVDELSKLTNAYFSSNSVHAQDIYILLSFQLWWQRWCN